MQTILFMEFLTSVLDTIITICMPSKVSVIQKESRRRGSFVGNFDDLNARTQEESIDFETSTVLSTLSSLDGDTDPTLMNPDRRKYRNDKEYLKYVKI